MKKLSIGILVISALLLSAGSVLAVVNPQTQDVTVNATVEQALSFSILSGATLNYDVDPSINNGQDTTKTTVMTVKTNAQSYQITENINHALQSTSVPTDTIPNYSGQTDNYFGYNLTGPGNATAGFGAGAVIKNGTGPTNGENTTVYYDLNVDYLTKAHNDYTATITYTCTATF